MQMRQEIENTGNVVVAVDDGDDMATLAIGTREARLDLTDLRVLCTALDLALAVAEANQ